MLPMLAGILSGGADGVFPDDSPGTKAATRVHQGWITLFEDYCKTQGCNFTTASQGAPFAHKAVIPSIGGDKECDHCSFEGVVAFDFRLYRPLDLGGGHVGGFYRACDLTKPIPPSAPNENGSCVEFRLSTLKGVHAVRYVITQAGSVILDWSKVYDFGNVAGERGASAILPPALGAGTYHIDVYVEWKLVGGANFTIP